MKLKIISNLKISNLLIFVILIIILYSNCFRFSSDPDDLIIKFNVENVKFKNNDYVSKVKNRVKKEMKIIKNKLSYMKIPDDIDTDSPVKIYEMQNATNNNKNLNDNFYEDEEINDFEEKDMIRKPKFSKLKTHLKNNSNFNTSDIEQFKALVYNKNTNNITFNYSIINENNIERKKTLKFFISSLLECNVMVNETIAYKSPERIKSIMHYLNTDRETRISPVGVYSSLGQVDYFAFQRSTKTFKVDFLEELTKNGKGTDNIEILNERGFFRSFGEKEEAASSADFITEEKDWNSNDNNAYSNNINVNNDFRKFFFNGVESLSINFLENGNFIRSANNSDVNNLQEVNNKKDNKNEINMQSDINNNKNNDNKLKKASINTNANAINNNNLNLKTKFPSSKKTFEKETLSSENKLSTKTNSKTSNQLLSEAAAKSQKTVSKALSSTSTTKKGNLTEESNPINFIDFSLEYIYDAKHLIHSVSDFRSTPDFNNITYNFDRFIWNLKNENSDKSQETVKIELFFDMEESFYSENIFVNLNFTKSIFLLNQTEKRAIENSYIKIDSNIMLETANYSFIDGSVYLMEKVMNSSPDLDRIQYYVKSKKDKHKNELIKIMKVEAEKVLKHNESFQLEVKFPLYFENCRNYKTNTVIMITSIVLMVFLGSLIYLVVSLVFSDKE